MTQEQGLILAILAATVGMFLWGRWRHDMVALGSLLACVAAGLIPSEEAFAGFGHPAVVTVAAVLVLSHGLQRTGAVDVLARRVLPSSAGPMLAIAALAGLGAVLSAFMNNVGAMALLMPVAMQLAARHELPPAKILMPLAFGTILGGMTTLIGTPPNLIVSGFRAETGPDSFGMFDFTPVGLAVAAAGIAFLALFGRHLVPERRSADASGFDTASYLTEVRVTRSGKAAGRALREVESRLDEADAQIVGMVRNRFRVTAPNPARMLQPGDILVVEAEPEALSGVLSGLGLELEEEWAAREEQRRTEEAPRNSDSATTRAGGDEDNEQDDEDTGKRKADDEVVLQELAVLPGSTLIGRSASDIGMRARYGLNLLALSREGHRSIRRLRSTSLEAGDLLLVQGPLESLSAFASSQGCVPLAQRDIQIPDRRRAVLASVVMAAAIAGAAFGLVPAAISFVAGVLVFLAASVVPPRQVYDAVDWPVIVLLAALIPVAGVMATTGTADLLAAGLLDTLAQGHPVVALTLILVVTMVLSDFMNNAATAAVMCPVAISAALQLDANPDSFLMAVAVGASCAFLTPIGHQNNTLILGPGGLRFGDYWRLGLPMEVLVVLVGVPVLLWVWPL